MHHVLGYYIHHLDPIIFSVGPYFGVGPITPRWYGFSYLMGFLGAYILIMKLQRDGMLRLSRERVPDLVLNCCIFGVLIGGRLGFCLFYQPSLLKFTDTFPYWGVLRVWEGGMSAHGGVVFTILTMMWFGWRYRKEGARIINIGDAGCMVVPIGLCFGRIANFINGELYGHATAVPWAVKFPSEVYAPTNNVSDIPAAQVDQMRTAVGEYISTHWQDLNVHDVQDYLANHAAAAEELKRSLGTVNFSDPAQLTAVKHWLGNYLSMSPDQVGSWDLAKFWEHGNAGLQHFMHGWFDKILLPRHPSQLYESLLEGVLLFVIVWTIGRLWRKDGMASGAFLTFYPVMRIIGEQFRVGDTPQMVLGIPMSLGVIYSIPMALAGLGFWIYWVKRDRRVPWVRAEAAAAGGDAAAKSG